MKQSDLINEIKLNRTNKYNKKYDETSFSHYYYVKFWKDINVKKDKKSEKSIHAYFYLFVFETHIHTAYHIYIKIDKFAEANQSLKWGKKLVQSD